MHATRLRTLELGGTEQLEHINCSSFSPVYILSWSPVQNNNNNNLKKKTADRKYREECQFLVYYSCFDLLHNRSNPHNAQHHALEMEGTT
mmetsp:Transcript_48200/g.70421  ORF Transcript_48200/g.70421 Transcript_48200/m.70421 type:complete len:90 (+) Transcript_48200:311-580(+)